MCRCCDGVEVVDETPNRGDSINVNDIASPDNDDDDPDRMLMRRGHRLHSLHGAEPDMAGLARLPSVHRCRSNYYYHVDHDDHARGRAGHGWPRETPLRPQVPLS